MRSYPAFDQTIHVEFRAFPALLWLGAGFEVRIGDRVFRPRPGQITFFGQPLTAFEVHHQGKRITGMVRGTGSWHFLARKRYSLVVGLSELARDTQTMRNWPCSYLVLAVCCLLTVLAICGAIRLAALLPG